MADVANTKSTGPVSQGMISGGSTFNPKLKANLGGPKALNNSSEEARRTIMGMRVASTGLNGNVEGTLTHPPR